MHGFYLWRRWQTRSRLCTCLVIVMVEMDHRGIFMQPCLPEHLSQMRFWGIYWWWCCMEMINEPNKWYMCYAWCMPQAPVARMWKSRLCSWKDEQIKLSEEEVCSSCSRDCREIFLTGNHMSVSAPCSVRALSRVSTLEGRGVSYHGGGGESWWHELSCNYNVKLTNLLCEERWEVKRRKNERCNKALDVEMQIELINFEFQSCLIWRSVDYYYISQMPGVR